MWIQLLFVLLSLTAAYYIRWLILLRRLKSAPIKIPVPFFGHSFKFTKPVAILTNKYLSNGIYQLLLINEDAIVVTDYKHFEMTITSMRLLKKSKVYKYLDRWLGDGLLTSTGDIWAKRRKLITPTFHFKILESFLDIFNSSGNTLLEILDEKADKGSVDIYPLICRYTLDVICESAMGTTVNAQLDTNSEYVEAVRHMCKVTAERAFSLFECFDFFYKFTKNYSKELKCVKILHNYTLGVIASRRKVLEHSKPADEHEIDEIGIKKRVAFLDLLLKGTIDGRALTDNEIREEVDTFMFEGHDTTASAISFALYCIADHPEVQKKIMEEQNVIFKESFERNATYNDLQEMKYLEKVIKEVLRLYPSVPFIAREVNETITFPEGVTFTKGLQVIYIMYLLHRDPSVFPDPEKFDPERFSGDLGAKNPFAYLPFSAGPRNCIGQKFAMLEIKATISKIIRRFQLSPAVPRHVIDLLPETTLKSNNGILIQLKRRF